jgi:phosphomannomutase
MVVAGETLSGDEIQELRSASKAGPDPAPASAAARRCSTRMWRASPGRQARAAVQRGDRLRQRRRRRGRAAPVPAPGLRVTELFTEVDGNFPNHHPDPSDGESARSYYLQETMRKSVWHSTAMPTAWGRHQERQDHFPDRQLMLYAKDVLSRNPARKSSTT